MNGPADDFLMYYHKIKISGNENDMTAHAFLAVFCSSQWLSQIGPSAANDSATVSAPIFF